MDANLKAKWTAALRSGEYKQAQRQLKDGDAFCCLGVLCVVAGIEISADGRELAVRGKRIGYGPLSDLVDDRALRLWQMNDDGLPFTEIADYIEKNL